MAESDLSARIAPSVSSLDAGQWDALSGGDWSAGAVSEADMFEERE